ncbi:MAG TPA: efflux RND transporter permease subunit [Planctomycetota bacterium]|nr:MAG: Multidrug resistance protein MdtB [Planctomycetes bacterium ADurb.Bin069]HNR99969.1 efflux RND transporter permease subunit [Planctomycetota bacterium]HNU25677.1 efflux RND transporter permease subunit [Planctomycetota bacterium]HOE31091.1 efflux RND transporter permease subunit [Planctomycetota bacterium]HOE88042.1 efflux RND transporter permease subunit [Planctomycetota bacterium]
MSSDKDETHRHPAHATGWITALVRAFIDSKLTPLFLLFALLAGAFAVVNLSREEEPQIKVPMIDIFVRMECASPREIEHRITKPMEKLLWEIPGVEYIYSTSQKGMSMATVRFLVGHDEEDAIVKVNQKMAMHYDLIPIGGSLPLIKPRSIDDVPVLGLTFWSAEADHYELRRVAAETADAIKAVPDVSETTLIGGRRRQVRVILDPPALSAYGLAPREVLARLGAANARATRGEVAAANTEAAVDIGRLLHTAEEVGRVVVGVVAGKPVYLENVARVEDGPDEPSDYVFLEPGPAFGETLGPDGPREIPGALVDGSFPAVTLSVAKRKGSNAVTVVHDVMRVVERLRGDRIPEQVNVTVTRDYGATAAEKSNELLLHMAIAVVSVTILIWLILGWRESGIVAIAIPVTLALTLAVFYLLGYTLNRITLFALIFSIGILVDDPIVNVENIVRHFRMPQNKGRNLLIVTIEAVREVQSPLVLATFTVICAVLPMAFVRGLMGPYMRPIPVGASCAMLVSMLVAFVVTPWAAYRILRGPALRGTLHGGDQGEKEDPLTRFYRKVMRPFIRSKGWRNLFLAANVLLLLAALALVPLGAVVVKMLPFDNKSELQLIVDMPEGTTLEQTTQVARVFAAELRTEPEVTDIEVYAGTAGPFNFNGLVRHYFLRSGGNVADLQVNLVNKHQRGAQSHDFAKRVRPRLEELARRHGCRLKITEVPPGPPVLQTIVAEIYGPNAEERLAAARKVREIFEQVEGVVDVDWTVEDDQTLQEVVIDAEKAALNGVAVAAAADTAAIALRGRAAGLLHDEEEKEDVEIFLRLPREGRASGEDVLALRVASELPPHKLVPLGEIARVETRNIEQSIFHKNLQPVIYVTAEVYGRKESPIYAILGIRERLAQAFPAGLPEWWATVPTAPERTCLKWDGEMHVTVEVFRDLGLAFAGVLILIYVLVVGWFRSFTTPLVIMAAIPFSLVGILPAHGALGAFFTATSMIGFIAGAGIVVRNSIILIDFIELRLAEGMPLAEAVIDAGAVRFRPMFLTAAAVAVGAGVILFDPIFQGLALSLIAGEVAALLLSRMAVPILYYMRFAPR